MQSEPSELEQRVRLNALLDGYLEWPEWTPAVGAMLISGVRPPGMNCIEIPDIAPSLKSETTPADRRALAEAKKALTIWVDDQVENSECSKEQALSMKVTLFDFFRWCEDEYGACAEPFKPGWLDYWFGHIGWGGRDGIPRPAPRDLVARAAKLEMVEQYLKQQIFVGQLPDVGLVRSAEAQAYVDQMANNIMLRSRLPFKRVLIRALNEAVHPTDAKEVYDALFKLASQGVMPAHLQVQDAALSRLQQHTGTWAPYTTDALRQFLADYQPGAAASRSSRSQSS